MPGYRAGQQQLRDAQVMVRPAYRRQCPLVTLEYTLEKVVYRGLGLPPHAAVSIRFRSVGL